MLTTHHLSLNFGPLQALADISLQFPTSQIHGILGENGAGKSTLMNLLFGLLQPASGHIAFNNTPTRIPSPRHAQALGIGMVHQHFQLVPTLSPLHNLALATQSPPRKILPRALHWLDTLHWSNTVPLHTPIQNLSVGQQQRTEILKALLTTEHAASSRTLILDEPTAVLTPAESADLFSALRHLQQTGAAILFITHKLAEAQALCDTLSILRRGKLVHTGPAAALTRTQIATLMIGEPPPAPPPSTPHPATAPPILTLQNASAGILKDITLRLHPGQITAIAGVDGNGQSDLLAALLGALPLQIGTLTIAGHNLTKMNIRRHLDHLALIPADRHRLAAVLPLSITDNLLLKDYRRPPYATCGFLNRHSWRTRAADLLQRFDIRAASVRTPLARLSGGNQQKVVVARELADSQKPIVIAENPTRGLDLHAAAFVLDQLRAARDAGAAVLLIHPDLDELLPLADRLFVLYSGRLTETDYPRTTREEIGRLMLGVTT